MLFRFLFHQANNDNERISLKCHHKRVLYFNKNTKVIANIVRGWGSYDANVSFTAECAETCSLGFNYSRV